MPLNHDFVGRSYGAPDLYEVGREHLRAFVTAIGDPHPAHVDPEAARALGHPDVIAPPTYLTVLAFRFAAHSPFVDPAFGLDYARVVHGEEHFTHHRPVRAGDRLRRTARIDAIRVAGRNELVDLVTEVEAEDGEAVATIRTVVVSRGTAPDAA